jgi:hypothetical protein
VQYASELKGPLKIKRRVLEILISGATCPNHGL